MQAPSSIRLFILGCVGLIYQILVFGLNLIENGGLWTFRFRLSLYAQYFRIALTCAFATSLGDVLKSVLSGERFETAFLSLYIFAAGIWIFLHALAAKKSHGFFKERWAAWTGPSRTGISSELAGFIGGPRDWEVLQRTLTPARPSHAVEFWGVSWRRSKRGILADPTDLLKSKAAQTEKLGYPKTSFEREKFSVYYPQQAGSPISLLWGEQLGFEPRVSRAIISVPRRYLTPNPTTPHGFSAQAICLAYGILGRNKGPSPGELICNLEENNSFREFEESSIWWPRPAKTLRGYYKAEFKESFGGIGNKYVSAATELALILVDADHAAVLDWLYRMMEHQDLELNRVAAQMGATAEDLERLYRGHYAAMLVSLSIHTVGRRTRPEMLVFDRVCEKEGVDIPSWAREPVMMDRRVREKLGAEEKIYALIAAII